MGLYTKITRSWLEERFRRRSPSGVYFAHMPVYGACTPDAEGNQAGRLARIFRILQILDGLEFATFCDVGGAEGFLPHIVRKLYGSRVVSTDLSHEACLRARELFGLTSAAVDCDRLPFRDGAFDVVVCSEVIEHVENPVETMLELQRISRRALILTTEEIRYDRASIDDYLFKRPGWPHMERNLFHPDDMALCFKGATTTPQTDGPPRECSTHRELRNWISANTTINTVEPGRIGIVVSDIRDNAARVPRRHTDAQLLDLLLSISIPAGSTWPGFDTMDVPADVFCDPQTHEKLQIIGDFMHAPSGASYPIKNGVPDFVQVDRGPSDRANLMKQIAGLEPERRAGLANLRDRLALPERSTLESFDFTIGEHRRGFWPNRELVVLSTHGGFHWRSTGADPWVMTPCLDRLIVVVELEYSIHAPDIPVESGTGQIFWKGPADATFDESRSVMFTVPNDGKIHKHRVELGGGVELRKREVVQWLRLDLINGPCEIRWVGMRVVSA